MIFIINQEISLPDSSNKTFTDTTKITDFSVSDIVPEELVVIAVVFSPNAVEKYSTNDKNIRNAEYYKFNAYYADAASAAELTEGGNLPPTVGLVYPELRKVNIFDRGLFNTFFGGTYLIGKTTIKATAEDDKGVAKVEFYIDDELMYEDDQTPYEYSFRKIDMFKHLFRKHTIKIIAYDSDGRTSITEFDAFAVFL